MTIYITEQSRTFAGSGAIIKQLRMVSALISDTPEARGRLQDFKPEAWSKLIYSGDVMYRYRDEPFRKMDAQEPA